MIGLDVPRTLAKDGAARGRSPLRDRGMDGLAAAWPDAPPEAEEGMGIAGVRPAWVEREGLIARAVPC